MSDSSFFSSFAGAGNGLALGTASNLIQGGLDQLWSSLNAKRNWKYQQKAMAKQFDYNIQAADHTFDNQLKAWNLENEYNSPSAQMQRYKDAGLNPLLIYGNQQSGASLNVGQTSGSSLPSVNTSAGNTSDILSGIDAIQKIIMNNKQANLIQAQIDRLNKVSEEIEKRLPLYKLREDLLNFDFQFKRDNKDTMVKRIENQADYFQSMYEWNKLQKDTYEKTGVTTSDSLLERILARIIEKLGFSIEGGLNYLFKNW